jgi:hypothetical protein
MALLLLITGCSLAPSDEVMKALGKDPATVCIHVTSIYGTVKASRSACLNCMVQCSADGMTIRSGVGGLNRTPP